MKNNKGRRVEFNLGRKAITVLFLILFCFSGTLYASGIKEDKIAKARVLIDAKQYNEAILILAEVMRDDPEQFDIAQKMLDEVRTVRNSYNDKYNQLIDLYKQPDMDIEEAYKIFKDLEEMDKSPNKATAESFQKAKDTAIFVFNYNKFKKTMDEALVFLKENNYWDAVDVYLTGITLMEEDFNAADYGQLINSRVAAQKQRITDQSRIFTASKAGLQRLSQSLAPVIQNGDEGTVLVFMNELASLLEAQAAARKNALAGIDDLNAQNLLIKQQQGKEAFHLTFLNLLMHGRTDSPEPEGILAAMDAPWVSIAEQSEAAVRSRAREFIAAGLELFSGGRYAEAGASLARGNAFARYSSNLAGIWGTRIYLGSDLSIPPGDTALAREKAAASLVSAVQGKTADTLLALASDAGITESYRDGIAGMESGNSFRSVREDLSRIQTALRGSRREWAATDQYLSELAGTGWPVTDAVSMAGSVRGILDSRLSLAVLTEERLVAREAELQYRVVLSRFNQESAQRDRVKTILNGIEKPVPAGEEGAVYVSKDPAAARIMLQAGDLSLGRIDADNNAILTRLRAEDPVLATGEFVTARIKDGTGLADRIKLLGADIKKLLAQAADQIAQAEKFKNEAAFRLAESENALTLTDFDTARTRLRNAGDRYDASLAAQDDNALRAERDQKIADLGGRIAFAENELIVREVRALITEGKRYYTAENYEAAERVLQQALGRWRVTNPSNDNAELDYWLNIVRVALYMRSGRVIAQTDPLFTDMSNLLNLARDDFLKGKALVEKGRKNEALPFFEKAENKILLIKIPFPVNQEASVLSLQILQYRDLENFASLFRQKYNEAVAKIGRDAQNAYIELKDLQAISPNYPGIVNNIFNLELTLGIRVPPPDLTKQRRSDELYARALDVVQRNIVAQFPIALEYLNEAIKLTPEEQKVINLLDRVTSNIGGRSTIVLTNTAQQQYRQAEDAYIAGNFYEALRIVNNLMKDQKNTQYPPLIELKRRIESKI